MILKGKTTTSVKKHSSKSKRAKKNTKMEKVSKGSSAKDSQASTTGKEVDPKYSQEQQCPLCIAKLDLAEVDFYPCQCGYQVCLFCWHKIRTEENSLCPNCRRTYLEDPLTYKPLSQELVQKIKKEQKQKELQKKKEQIESRKQLANIRVVQKNLVFVHGLPQGIDTEMERYRRLQLIFKDFGPVVKCVVNNKTNYVGSQKPRASVYVTYQRIEDALKAYKSLPSRIEDYEVKTSLGTTKYCSNFLKNTHCPKQDCMYLHEVADEELCFTKDQIHNSEHLEFGDQLYEKMVNQSAAKSPQSNQPKEPVSAPIEPEEVQSKLNSLQIKDTIKVPTPTQSPRLSFPTTEPTIQQSKFQQLFSSNSKNSINQVNGSSGSSTPNFPSSHEETPSSRFFPCFTPASEFDDRPCLSKSPINGLSSLSAISTTEHPFVQKSLMEESAVNTPRPALNSENFIRPDVINSSQKEMWHGGQSFPVNVHKGSNNVSNQYIHNHINPTSQVLQGLTLNHEDGPFFQKSQPLKRPDDQLGPYNRKSLSPEIHDDDLEFDPVVISLTNLSNIVQETSQIPIPTRKDMAWNAAMNEQRALQHKLNMQKLKNPPPGFLMNQIHQNQPLASPGFNNADNGTNILINRMSPPPRTYPCIQQLRTIERPARYHQFSRVTPYNGNPHINRMPVINSSNSFMRTNYQRYPQGNMPLGGIPSINGLLSQSHRSITPQTIPLQAQAMQEMLARSVNATQHIQPQSQNLTNHMPFAHLEQNLSPSLWNVNQTSINQSQWMPMETSYQGQNIQDFRPASPSLNLQRRIPPQVRPDFPRQIPQPLARFTNPPNFTDTPQYMFPNSQYNQLTKGVPTLP